MLANAKPRAVYEGMPRGDLINALAAIEHDCSRTSARRLEAVEAEHADLREQVRLLRDRSRHVEIAQARFADLFALAPIAYCLLHRDGAIEATNAAAEILFCTSSSKLVGAQLTQLVQTSQAQTFLDHIARCLDERLRVSCELKMIVAGRGELSVQVVSTPHICTEGWADTCRTMFYDMTPLRRAAMASELLTRLDDAFAEETEVCGAAAAVARSCVPVLGDVAFVDLICDDARLRRASRAIEPHHTETADAVARHVEDASWDRFVKRAIETGEPLVDASRNSALGDTIHAKACIVAPLVARQKPVGVLGVLRIERPYVDKDLELVARVARRAARSIDTALAVSVLAT